MTEEQKPERKKAAPKTSARKPRATTARNKTAAGQTVTDARSTRKSKYGDDIIATARALYEGDPTISKRQVAEEMGIPYTMVDKWSKGGADGTGEKWAKLVGDKLSERAHAVADKYKGKLSELGPEITTEQQKKVVEQTVEDTAVELRAALINKHRQEWSAVRNLLYKGMKQATEAKGFEASKFAKISAETMKIMHDSERRAWGIDSGPDGQTKVQVVIERE